MENKLKFRAGGLTGAVGSFPSGLVLIEKELKEGDGKPEQTGYANSSIMSDDILMYARREAARIRQMQQARQTRSPERAPAAPFPAAARHRASSGNALLDVRPRSASTAPPQRTKSVTISRPKSAVSNLAAKKSTSFRSDMTAGPRLSDQLCHIRSEMEGLADRLAESVPSDLEDVDTEFDDESNRWFAREFYAVKHECTLIKKLRDINRQRVGVVKLHRTALRLVQVAASRPILRVLNPHIYGQLGDLVRDLVNLSDQLELPLWDPEPVLEALEKAVYFPPRKSASRRTSIKITPSDIAAVIPPQNRRSVSRKKPPQKMPQNKKRLSAFSSNSKNFDGKEKMENRTAIYSPQRRRSSNFQSAKKKTSNTKNIKNTKSSKTFGSPTKRSSKGQQSAPRRTKSILKSAPSDLPTERLSTIVGRLVDIDSLEGPITSDEDNLEPMTTEYRPTTATSSPTAGKEEKKQQPAADIIKPDIHTKNTASGQTVQIRVDHPSSTRLRYESRKKSENLGRTVISPRTENAQINNVLAQLDRIEREEDDVRARLAHITQSDISRRNVLEKQNKEAEVVPMVTSEIFQVKLLQNAISHSHSELKMNLTKSTRITNRLADLILNDVVDEIVKETEQNLGSFVDSIYESELNGFSSLNPMSVLSNTLNSSMGTLSIAESHRDSSKHDSEKHESSHYDEQSETTIQSSSIPNDA